MQCRYKGDGRSVGKGKSGELGGRRSIKKGGRVGAGSNVRSAGNIKEAVLTAECDVDQGECVMNSNPLTYY